MATRDYKVESYNIAPFWNDEFKSLNYIKEPFNDPTTVDQWTAQGFAGPFGGWMCDMRSPQPSWNQEFIDFFSALGWKDIGTSYYRMDAGHVLPTHADTYQKYIDLFKLQGKEHTIHRAVVFLEDWKPGHYAECIEGYANWIKGFTLVWDWDTPHLAANLGTVPRYTLQITGHI